MTELFVFVLEEQKAIGFELAFEFGKSAVAVSTVASAVKAFECLWRVTCPPWTSRRPCSECNNARFSQPSSGSDQECRVLLAGGDYGAISEEQDGVTRWMADCFTLLGLEVAPGCEDCPAVPPNVEEFIFSPFTSFSCKLQQFSDQFLLILNLG